MLCHAIERLFTESDQRNFNGAEENIHRCKQCSAIQFPSNPFGDGFGPWIRNCNSCFVLRRI